MGPRRSRRESSSDDPRQRLGSDGERAAERVLREAGLSIVERRFRLKIGEIDLIASDGPLVVFVEVKTRRGSSHGLPAQAVTPRKRATIARVAAAYLVRRGLSERPCRFDVVQVFAGRRGVERVDHIRDAFRLWDDDRSTRFTRRLG
ncbi:MAG TPA: YraN family protein [Candidatus Polarisedimenticolaceae bacterium]|nr:YraN family protein [Candidatus Polarisedimenticolaceae bacterium]